MIELSWKDALSDIRLANKSLAQEIESLNPSNDYTVIKVSYPWGQHLLHEGVLQLPNDKGIFKSLSASNFNATLQKKLNYNHTIPLGIVLNNAAELYINANNRIIPFKSFTKGKIFALWVSLQGNKTSNHTGRVSNIIAGTRSAIVLPKIADLTSYNRLKKHFNLVTPRPNGLKDQWPLLHELAKHCSHKTPWTIDVLYFTHKWIKERNNPKWRSFYCYLLESAWNESDYLRNQLIVDIAFSCALSGKNLKPNPYLSDTVKHLYALGQGIYPGFKLATDDTLGPISSFQEILMDVYQLKYAPTIFCPGYFTGDEGHPIYYSLEIPTLMAFSPKSRKAANKMNDLREIKHVIDGVTAYILKDELRLKESPLHRLAQQVQFNYYHSDKDEFTLLAQSSSLPENDICLRQFLEKCNNKTFCDTSPFLRGCISISKKSL